MGVATLLNLVDYFAKNRPKRDIIFNINNGEEDWLNGAHAFLEHPWAKLPTVFLNLEGAGNAGYVPPMAWNLDLNSDRIPRPSVDPFYSARPIPVGYCSFGIAPIELMYTS